MAASADFAQDLIAWHEHYGRHDLPWQTTPVDPYRVWLSEIMLQQTQVATVIPYFHRFLAEFPTLSDLAQASEQQVLALWAGLGYYQRGRNLLRCAQTLVRDHDGQFPSSAQALEKLPGIGRSTAAAIASTVYQERVAILDGNVQRVLARLTCTDAPWGSPSLNQALWPVAQAHLPKDPASMPAYTQAIMDLGAMVCRARQPACAQCPVQRHCSAFAQNRVDAFPRPKAKKIIPTRQAYWAVLMSRDHVWLMQQPDKGIWPSLWVPWQLDLQHPPRNWRAVGETRTAIISLRHQFTHYKLEIEAGCFAWSGNRPVGAPRGLIRWTWADALSLPCPAPVSRLLARLAHASRESDGEPHRRNLP
jgi:A/G-specific adenine glycosylase